MSESRKAAKSGNGKATGVQQPARTTAPTAGTRRKESNGAASLRELKESIAAKKSQIRRTELLLGQLGPDGNASEPIAVTRRREALRRVRIRHLLTLDRLEDRLSAVGAPGLARNAPGFRHGVRRVVPGGAPGLGKWS